MPLGSKEEEKLERIPSAFVRSRRSFLWKDIVKRFIRNRLALFGLIIVTILILVAIFASFIVPYQRAVGFYPEEAMQPPSIKHPMGTDRLGRDIFTRVIHGSRVSVEVGIIAVAIGIIIGLLLGAISGYFGSILDSLIMRTADIFFAFPFLLGALAMMTVLGPGLINVFLAIGILEWAYFARLFRGSILSVKENQYIEAARALGASHLRIIWRHIFPNAFQPVIIYAAMSVGGAILTEAGLSFLGLGVKPPTPSWGMMLADSMAYIDTAPWMMYFPGLALLLAVLGFILLADGLRDALDPRLK